MWKLGFDLKTLRISDGAHAKLTSIVGRLIADTGKMKTYSDAMEALLSKSVMLPPELLDEIETFIQTNAHLSYAIRERSLFKMHCVSG
jgi:hypothetical protein